MAADAAFVSAVEDVIANYLSKGPSRVLRDAVTLPGTWNEAAGEIDVVTLESLAQIDDDSSAQPEIYRGLQLLTPFGMQHGPRGHERCVLIPGESGQRVMLEHGMDDSPGAKAGQPIMFHRKTSSDPAIDGAIDASLQFTDDAMPGDGKGATRVLVGALLSLASTLGFSLTIDDAARRFTLATPDGLQLILAGDLGKILIGNAALGTMDSLMTQADAQQLANDILASVGTGFTTFGQMVQPGSGTVPAPTLTMVTAKGSSISESAE